MPATTKTKAKAKTFFISSIGDFFEKPKVQIKILTAVCRGKMQFWHCYKKKVPFFVRRREPENRSGSGLENVISFSSFRLFSFHLFSWRLFSFLPLFYGFKIYSSNILSYKKVSTLLQLIF